MSPKRRAAILLLTIILLSTIAPTTASCHAAKAAVLPIQRRADFIPLGVYWPGEATFRDAPTDAARWSKVDVALTGMAKHHINAIWIVNENTSWAAELARHAKKYDIYIVAATNELEGKQEWVRHGDHAKLIAQTLHDWGDAPPPIAWGLGDEPTPDILPDMASYVTDWGKDAPGEPVTAVEPWNAVAAAAKLPFTMLTSDVYVFFYPGSPLGYPYGSDWGAWQTLTRQLVSLSPRPWMMGQACQEAIGPYQFDAQGNLVYLPTAITQYVTPTPAQITWQAWSAFALGAKGMFYYHYALPDTPQPQGTVPAALAKMSLPGVASVPTDSGAPQGLVYSDGRTTPQYEALGAAFGQIARLSPTLAPLKLSTPPGATLASSSAGGAIATLLIHPQTGKRYLMVVAPYTGTGLQTVSVLIDPQIVSLRNVLTGQTTPTVLFAPSRRAMISLPPGEGALYECILEH